MTIVICTNNIQIPVARNMIAFVIMETFYDIEYDDLEGLNLWIIY